MYRQPYKLMEDLYFSDSFQRVNILSDEITRMGCNPIFQRVSYQNSSGYNIVVELKGISNSTVILSAHYDGNGAYDNIGGVFMLLSLIEKFRNISPLYSFKFVFFDNEEKGQIGSKLFVENYDIFFGKDSMKQILQHIAIDGCGIGEKLVYINKLNKITFLINKKELNVPLLADFQSFQSYGIPSVHTFSLPEEEAKGLVFNMKFPDTWLILHSEDDNLNNVKIKDFKAFELTILNTLDMLTNSKTSIFKKGIYILNTLIPSQVYPLHTFNNPII